MKVIDGGYLNIQSGGCVQKNAFGVIWFASRKKGQKGVRGSKPPPPPLPHQSYQRIINRLHFYFICAKFTEKDQMIAISWKP